MIVPGHQLACLLNQDYDDDYDDDIHDNIDEYEEDEDEDNEDVNDIKIDENMCEEDDYWFWNTRQSKILLSSILFILVLGSYEFGHFMGRSQNSCSANWSPITPMIVIVLLIIGMLWIVLFASSSSSSTATHRKGITDLKQMTHSIRQEISSLLGQIHAPPLAYYSNHSHHQKKICNTNNNMNDSTIQDVLEFTKFQVDLCLAYENAMTCIQYATLYPYTYKVPNTTSFVHHLSKNRNVLLQSMIQHYTLLYNALHPENHNNLTQQEQEELLLIPDNSTLQYYSKEIRQLLSEILSSILTSSSFNSSSSTEEKDEEEDFIQTSIPFFQEQIQYITNYYPLFQKHKSQITSTTKTTTKKLDRHLVQLQSRMEAATVSLWSLEEFINTPPNDTKNETSIHQLWSQFQTLFQDCQQYHDFLVQEYSDILQQEKNQNNNDDPSVQEDEDDEQNQQMIPIEEESLHYSSQGSITPKEITPILDVNKERNTLIFSAIGELQKRRLSTRTTKRVTKPLSTLPLPKNNHYFLHELTSTLANRDYPMEEESETTKAATATAVESSDIAVEKQKSNEIRSPSLNLGLSNSLLQELKSINIPSPTPTIINSDDDYQTHTKKE